MNDFMYENERVCERTNDLTGDSNFLCLILKLNNHADEGFWLRDLLSKIVAEKSKSNLRATWHQELLVYRLCAFETNGGDLKSQSKSFKDKAVDILKKAKVNNFAVSTADFFFVKALGFNCSRVIPKKNFTGAEIVHLLLNDMSAVLVELEMIKLKGGKLIDDFFLEDSISVSKYASLVLKANVNGETINQLVGQLENAAYFPHHVKILSKKPCMRCKNVNCADKCCLACLYCSSVRHHQLECHELERKLTSRQDALEAACGFRLQLFGLRNKSRWPVIEKLLGKCRKNIVQESTRLTYYESFSSPKENAVLSIVFEYAWMTNVNTFEKEHRKVSVAASQFDGNESDLLLYTLIDNRGQYNYNDVKGITEQDATCNGKSLSYVNDLLASITDSRRWLLNDIERVDNTDEFITIKMSNVYAKLNYLKTVS